MVVMANSEPPHTQQHQHPQQQPRPPQHDISENLIEPSTAFSESTAFTTVRMDQVQYSHAQKQRLEKFQSVCLDGDCTRAPQEMAAMTEMSPPPPEPMIVSSLPFASPSSSPPPPEPAAPEEAGMIPAAGDPMGAWLPMVMLPPAPFSADMWALRHRLPRPTHVRRTSFRKKVYD